jgi:hypothetical protein
MTSIEVARLAMFEGKQIRKTIHNDEWWFSVADVVEVLTDSVDSRQYIKRMRQRDLELDSYWGTICTPLEMVAPDGKRRKSTAPILRGFSASSNPFLPLRPSRSSAGWPRLDMSGLRRSRTRNWLRSG